MFKDLVNVADSGSARLLTRSGEVAARRQFGGDLDKPVIQVKGWVEIVARERGKKVPSLCRSGHNIWTNTGREFLAMLMSIQTGTTPYRSDRISYIGVGTGSQIEDVGVTNLVTPAEYVTGQFLAPIDHSQTAFPLLPSRTAVRYYRLFEEGEITLSPGSTVYISEAGLFTNGDQDTFVAEGRDTTYANSAFQSPVAYKSLEPIGKTSWLELELTWEIRL